MSTPDEKESGSTRKAYHSPIIRHYGAIRAITEAIGMTSANSDGGKKGNKKTK